MKMQRGIENCFILICVFRALLNGESITNVKQVLNDYFSPAFYSREIRGKLDQTQPLNINSAFSLVYIKSVNEIEETIETVGILFLSWKDERLIWDPGAYNGTDKVYITASKIWHPEITLENPARPFNYYGDVTRLLSLHKYDGEASLVIGDIFECSCSFDLTSFPWDKQKCDIVFVVWGYLATEVILVAQQAHIDLKRYKSNSVWTLLSTRVYSKPDPGKSLLAFQIVLQRRPLFFIVNIMLPIITLSVLELFVFIIPADSGERISFSLTVLLSIAVFLTLLSDNLPPSAETMAAICYLLVSILIESALICLLNILSVKLYLRHAESPDVGTFWRKFVNIFGRKTRCRRRKRTKIKPYDRADESVDEDTSKDEDFSVKIYTWKEVSETFDCVVATLMSLLLCLTFCMYSYYVAVGMHVN